MPFEDDNSRNPNPQMIQKIMRLNCLFDVNLFSPYGKYATDLFRGASSLLLDTLMRPENIRRDKEVAMHDKHRDGAISVNSGILMRDILLPAGSKNSWGFAEDTRTIGDITSSLRTSSTLHSLTYAIYALQEDTKKPSLLEPPFTYCDIVNDSREGTLAFIASNNLVFMNNGFTMTDRRISDLRYALKINNSNEWLKKNFGDVGDGGGIQAVIFGSIYDALVNCLVFDKLDYVFGLRVSAESTGLLVLENYFDGTTDSVSTVARRTLDTINKRDGSVGLNKARYIIVKVKNIYANRLKNTFYRGFSGEPMDFSNNQLNTYIERAIESTSNDLEIDPLELMDIYYGEIALCDLNTHNKQPQEIVVQIPTKMQKIRGFTRYENIGMYLRQKIIT